MLSSSHVADRVNNIIATESGLLRCNISSGNPKKKSTQRLSCVLSIRLKCLIVAAAGRRNNAVHAQVFHHLAIVIKGMGHGEAGAEELGGLSLTKGTGHQGDGAFRSQRFGGLVP